MLFPKKYTGCFTGKAKPEEMRWYSEAAEAELIEDIRRQMRELLEDLKGSHARCLWPQLEEKCREWEENQIAALQLVFFQKRTGRPF